MEKTRDSLQRTVNELQRQRADYARRKHALYHDNHYRERILRQVTGAHRGDEQSLEEWLRWKRNGKGSRPVKGAD